MNKILLLIALWIFLLFVSIIVIPLDDKKNSNETIAIFILAVLFATMITALIGGIIL